MVQTGKSKILIAASTLAWFSFIFGMLSCFAFLRELAHAGKKFEPLLLLLFFIAILYAFSGWGLARRIRPAGMACLVAASLNFGIHVVFPVPVAPLILLINIALAILVIAGWKDLKGRGEA